jgi:hypothetical protein
MAPMAARLASAAAGRKPRVFDRLRSAIDPTHNTQAAQAHQQPVATPEPVRKRLCRALEPLGVALDIAGGGR